MRPAVRAEVVVQHALYMFASAAAYMAGSWLPGRGIVLVVY